MLSSKYPQSSHVQAVHSIPLGHSSKHDHRCSLKFKQAAVAPLLWRKEDLFAYSCFSMTQCVCESQEKHKRCSQYSRWECTKARVGGRRRRMKAFATAKSSASSLFKKGHMNMTLETSRQWFFQACKGLLRTGAWLAFLFTDPVFICRAGDIIPFPREAQGSTVLIRSSVIGFTFPPEANGGSKKVIGQKPVSKYHMSLSKLHLELFAVLIAPYQLR